MPYTSNPFAPNARMKARNDVVWGRLTISQAAVKYGVHRSTVWKWLQKAKKRHLNGNTYLWTLSSAPHHHPNELKPEIVSRIIELREKLRGRCAPVIHEHLKREGVSVSLSSVERTLRREKLTRKKKQAKWYTPLPRPASLSPGDLVQVDTIHIVRPDYTRFYIYTLIDTFTRLAYAEYHDHLLQKYSFGVVMKAQKTFGFRFSMLQTDNGLEFRDGFQAELGRASVALRHSRIRKPNDNAHIERFNRTLQEECLDKIPNNVEAINIALKKYLKYYNYERVHAGINYLIPMQVV